MWKVTITTTNLYSAYLYNSHYRPPETVRVFKHKWRANVFAFWSALSVPGLPIIRLARVEPYEPGSNVVEVKFGRG